MLKFIDHQNAKAMHTSKICHVILQNVEISFASWVVAIG